MRTPPVGPNPDGCGLFIVSLKQGIRIFGPTARWDTSCRPLGTPVGGKSRLISRSDDQIASQIRWRDCALRIQLRPPRWREVPQFLAASALGNLAHCKNAPSSRPANLTHCLPPTVLLKRRQLVAHIVLKSLVEVFQRTSALKMTPAIDPMFRTPLQRNPRSTETCNLIKKSTL